jgi:hypothetical protein
MAQPMTNEVHIHIPIEYGTSGIKHLELIGPVYDYGTDCGRQSPMIRLDMWVGYKSDENNKSPDFSVLLNIQTANNLRNAISAAIMMIGK